jgi:hypothetical protein
MEVEKIDLKKVPGSTPEDRQRWGKAFQEEEEAKARCQAFDQALIMVAELKPKAEATLTELENSLLPTILDWATGKQPRKVVEDLRRSIAKYRELIADCNKIPPLIQERRPGISNKTEKANNARFQIQEKFKRAEEAKKG